MGVYIAKDGERIDQIVFDYYGSLSRIKTVLEDNIHLISKFFLHAGDEVFLRENDLTEEVKEADESKSLW